MSSHRVRGDTSPPAMQNGPTYISNFFKLRNTPYALRGSGHNVVQDVYNIHLMSAPEGNS